MCKEKTICLFTVFISFAINKFMMNCLDDFCKVTKLTFDAGYYQSVIPYYMMASDLIILISLIIVMFSLFMVLDSTSQKLSVA